MSKAFTVMVITLLLLLVLSWASAGMLKFRYEEARDNATYWKQNATELDRLVWGWFRTAKELNPKNQTICWFKLHRGTDQIIKKIRVFNYSLPTFDIYENGTEIMYERGECDRLYELCDNTETCWWDNRTTACNCDVHKLSNGGNWTW